VLRSLERNRLRLLGEPEATRVPAVLLSTGVIAGVSLTGKTFQSILITQFGSIAAEGGKVFPLLSPVTRSLCRFNGFTVTSSSWLSIWDIGNHFCPARLLRSSRMYSTSSSLKA
jgi:hypothetical protein